MEKKKILHLISAWDMSFVQQVIDGVRKAAREKNYEVHVCVAYDVLERSNFYMMEKNIFKLPDAKQYDGAILTLNTSLALLSINPIIDGLRSAGVKMVSIDCQFPGVPSIGIDNYKSFYGVVEHLITVHGCSNLVFVGGPVEHPESTMRYQAFVDCLHAHNLPCGPERVDFYNFISQGGSDAYKNFKAKKLGRIDGVVCANDKMAVGYCDAAAADGLTAPNDFRIVGFDNDPDGQHYYPSITSVGRNWSGMGYESVMLLDRQLNGEVVEINNMVVSEPVLNQSCGCANEERNVKDEYIAMLESIKAYDYRDIIHSHSRQLLCYGKEFEEFPDELEEYARLVNSPELAVCLNNYYFDTREKSDRVDFDNRIECFTKNGRSTIYRNEQLLPQEWIDKGEYEMYIISALHFESRNFGYLVAPAVDGIFDKIGMRTVAENLYLALENKRQKLELKDVNDQLKILSMRDGLTGLYNRNGYMDVAARYFEEKKGKVYLVYCDMDDLKRLNDQYGHDMGDKAIVGIANALKDTFADTDIHVRMGGDEFLVIGSYKDKDEIIDKEKRTELYLLKYGLENGFPFDLRVSLGHVFNIGMVTGANLEELVRKADDKMYKTKQERKKRRALEERMYSD